MKDKDHFFGEWVEYRSEEEKIEAIQYLELWRKFFIRKVPDLEFVTYKIIDKENIVEKSLSNQMSTLGIKIMMRRKKQENALPLNDIHETS